MKKNVISVLASLLLLVAFQSCSKDEVRRSRGTMDPDGKPIVNVQNSSAPGGRGALIDPDGRSYNSAAAGPGGAGWQMDPNGGG